MVKMFTHTQPNHNDDIRNKTKKIKGANLNLKNNNEIKNKSIWSIFGYKDFVFFFGGTK